MTESGDEEKKYKLEWFVYVNGYNCNGFRKMNIFNHFKESDSSALNQFQGYVACKSVGNNSITYTLRHFTRFNITNKVNHFPYAEVAVALECINLASTNYIAKNSYLCISS